MVGPRAIEKILKEDFKLPGLIKQGLGAYPIFF